MAKPPDSGKPSRPENLPPGDNHPADEPNLDEIFAADEVIDLDSVEVVEEPLEVAADEVLEVVDTTDSAVDLGREAPPSSGGDVSFDWAGLADNPAPSSHPSEPARFDAPSDADVLENAPSSLLPGQPVAGSESDDALTTMPAVDLGVESSRVDLGEPAPQRDPFRSNQSDEDEVIDLEEDISGAEIVDLGSVEAIDLGRPQVILPPDSGLSPADDEVIDLEEPSGATLLDQRAVVHDEADEEIDLEAQPSGSPSSSAIDLSGEDVIVSEESPSAVDSGLLAHVAGQESGINLDHFEEVVADSGVSLADSDTTESPDLPLQFADDSHEVVVEEPIVVDDGSSSVNLGETLGYEEGELAASAEEPSATTLVPGQEEAEDEAFNMFSDESPSSEVVEHDAMIEEEAEGPPSRGTGEVQLGGPRPVLDDSNEGTLEYSGDEAVVDQAAEEELVAPTKPSKGKKKALPRGDEGEDLQAPAKPDKPKKRGVLPMLATGVGSLLVGAAACFGALYFMGMVQLETKPTTKQPSGPPPKQTPLGSVAREVPLTTLVDGGDFKEAPPPIEDGDPKQIAARGQYRWLKHVQSTVADREKKLSADDAEVKEALADLQLARDKGDPEAALWMGHIHEMTKNLAEARKVYTESQKQFEKDAKFGPLFQSALDRLDVTQPQPGAQTRLPSSDDLLLVLLLLQVEPPAEGPAEPAEAGVEFWRALKLAQTQKYAEAAQAIAEARKRHEERRFLRLRKAQNPTSDPNEDIFLKACDELARLWSVHARLRAVPGLAPADAADPVKSVDAVVALLTRARTDNATLMADKTKLMNDLDKVTTEKTKAEDKVKDLDTKLTAALTKIADTEKDRDAKLKDKDREIADAKKTLMDTETKLTAANNQVAALDRDKKGLIDTQTTVAGKLEKAMLVPPKADAKQVLAGIDRVIKLAEMKDPAAELRNCMMDGEKLKDELSQRWTPGEMLGVWQPLLADRRQGSLAPRALKDVDRVRTDPKAAAPAKAQALYVEALALRSQNKNDEARAKLAEALKSAAPTDTWRAEADRLNRELSDPTVFYLPEAERQHRARNYAEALSRLDEAVELFPGSKGRLKAMRAQVRLDMLLDQKAGKIDAATPGAREVEADTTEALTAMDAAFEANLAEGRRLEALGQFDRAAEHFEKAMQAGKGAQVLEAKAHLARALYNGSTDDSVLRSYKVAEELLQHEDIDKYPLVKAQALLVRQKWTPALKAHAQGLQPLLRHSHGATLLELIQENPRLEDGADRAAVDPFAGEKNYALGLDFYYSRRYEDAERALQRAVDADNQDARYYYFLGLARLAQQKQGPAVKAFDQGARLEMQNKPPTSTVANSLERVQGPPRRMINEARNRARE